MRAFNATVLFIMIWWVVLFAVLPFGVRTIDAADNPARWHGAPERPMLWRKLLATTVVSLVVWGILVTSLHEGWIDFRPAASVTGE